MASYILIILFSTTYSEVRLYYIFSKTKSGIL